MGIFGNKRSRRWLVGVAILAAVECAAVAAVGIAAMGEAQAQKKFLYQRGGGFFQQFFDPFRPQQQPDYQQYRSDRVYHSNAPPPRKRDSDEPPATTVLVVGDGMADWLGYGLEEAFEETPEVAIVRKEKQRSGLLRYDSKSDLDWWHVARDILSQEKADYVVMMLGVSDREKIREQDLEKEAEKRKADKEKAEQAKQAKQDKDGATKKNDDKKNDDKKKAEAEKPKRNPNGVIEFRSDRWAQVYARRIDETIAALKSKGVPVFWVGLPSIRGTKSTADAVYLNDIFRARAERAGIVYVDIWDGFVTESGNFSSYGPDYEGQRRRLRSSDGVYFTKSGARKLAHYVEREIRRFMANRATPVALPTGPLEPQQGGKSAGRPVVGPVVPLTTVTGRADALLGASGTRLGYGDSTASSVLVNGQPLAAPTGRADDFSWQQDGQTGAAAPNGAAVPNSAAAKPASKPTTTAAAPATEPAAGAAPKGASRRAVRKLDMRGGDQTTPDPKPQAKPKTGAAASIAGEEPKQDKQDKQAEAPPPQPVQHHTTRRKRTIFPFDPFGWLR